MGIRFRCHHCESELHVKDFQGGKRGRCPDCGGKFRIPLSDAPHSLDAEAVLEDDAGEPAALPQGPTPDVQRDAPAAQPATASSPSQARAEKPRAEQARTEQPRAEQPRGEKARAEQPRGEKARGEQPMASQTPAVAVEQPAVPVEAAAEQVSPLPPSQPAVVGEPQALREAPHSTWYVRPTSGGQYGPAPSASVLQWLHEQRIAHDAYVWREGWPEWQLAAQVFADFFTQPAAAPRLPSAATPGEPALEAGPSEQPASVPNVSSAAPSLSERNRAQRKSKRRRNYALMICLLGLVMLGLVAALIWVLMQQAQPAVIAP